MQMPHDLFGWRSMGSIIMGGLWWVLKNIIVNSINGLRTDMDSLKDELKKLVNS